MLCKREQSGGVATVASDLSKASSTWTWHLHLLGNFHFVLIQEGVCVILVSPHTQKKSWIFFLLVKDPRLATRSHNTGARTAQHAPDAISAAFALIHCALTIKLEPKSVACRPRVLLCISSQAIHHRRVYIHLQPSHHISPLLTS